MQVQLQREIFEKVSYLKAKLLEMKNKILDNSNTIITTINKITITTLERLSQFEDICKKIIIDIKNDEGPMIFNELLDINSIKTSVKSWKIPEIIIQIPITERIFQFSEIEAPFI